MDERALIPVFRGDYQKAALLKSFIESDDIDVTMTPDVKSDPLQGFAAHQVKTQYSLYVLLVRSADQDRAREMIEAFDPGAGGD